MDKTTDYSIFNKVQGNRKIVESHVLRLMESIKAKNLLHMRPIVVDHDFGVVDGQHRLEAAKRLGTPIFYVKATKEDEITPETIMIFNTNQLNYTPEQYVEFYAARGNKHYKTLDILSKKYGIPLSLMCSFILARDRESRREFNGGKFELPTNVEEIDDRLEWTQRICTNIRKKYIDKPVFLSLKSFWKALGLLLSCPSVDPQMLYDKVETYMDKLRPAAGYREYTRMLLHIYNVRNQNKVMAEELECDL